MTAFKLTLLFVLISSITAESQVINNKSPLALQTTACRESLFFKFYDNPTTEPLGYDMVAMQDSSVIIVGESRNNSSIDFTDGFITKINKQGDVIWSKLIDGPGDEAISSITKLNDGNLAIVGVLRNNITVGFFILKIDVNGNQIWRRDYQIPNPTEFLWQTIIREDINDGSLIIASKFLENGLSFSDRVLFIKTNSIGTILTTNYYTPPGIISSIGINDIIIKDGYSYIAGNYYYQTSIKGLIVKINNTNGISVWTKFYDFNNDGADFTQIFPFENNKICLVGNDDINPQDTSLLFVVDTAGLCTSSNFFQFNANWPRQFGSAAITANNEVVWSMYHYRIPTHLTTMTLSRINPVTGIIYSRDFPQQDSFPIIHKTVFSSDSSIFCMGYREHTNGEYSTFLSKYSKTGQSGCPSVPISATFGSGFTLATTLPMNITSKSFPEITSGTSSPFLLVPRDSLCVAINYCDTLKIHGEDTICTIQQDYFFSAFKNPACITNIDWEINPNVIQTLLQTNDTTLRIRFNQNWQGHLYARIQTSCGIILDSLYITVLNSPGQVSLGPDTSLCHSNTRILNARSGYLSYLWQDGSTDSTFNVTIPGLYWVEVKDGCNTISRDSVIVFPAPPIAFDLGADLIKCNNDSLTITAPPGFLNYTWSPNYNITTATGQVSTVFPAVDTMYKVTAEKTPGCFAYDSVLITVNNSPPINLGPNTSFCNGDSLILDAGTGFTGYQWNNGQTSPSISVKAAGSYFINAVAANGCISRDTLIIANVFNNPVINLGSDAMICEQSVKQLNAGAGYSSYTWSTGNTSPAIAVNSTGSYWVTVTDNNNCKGADTILINGILPVPKKFLPADSVLCSYSSITLNPLATFTAYLWNTGASSPAIKISLPGTYSLQVLDANNCTGKDTIIITPKQCLDGFYIPDAFTPNNDGKNDIFRPLLFGNVAKYEFSIYNRWGQVVFTTKDLQKGWNGKVTGVDTDTNVFVWQCSFQFEGQPAQFRKGTLTLIR